MDRMHERDGATLEEAMAPEGEEGVEATFESDITAPGTWVAVCPLAGPGGEDHAQVGMAHELTIS